MLVVNGNSGDTLQLVNLSDWMADTAQSGTSLAATYGSAYGFSSASTYVAYSLNGATVFVQTGVTVQTATATSASAVYSQPASVESLFGSSAGVFSDVNSGQTFKGVAVTGAGTAAQVTAQGSYQYSTDGGSTWTSIAGGLTDATAVYLPASALIRFAAASGKEALLQLDLLVRLIDSSGATGTASLTAGQTVDASVNGGSTALAFAASLDEGT